MATCKDCIHHDLCFDNGTLFLRYAKGIDKENAETKCPFKNFKNKADFAEVVHSKWNECHSCETNYKYCDSCGVGFSLCYYNRSDFRFCPYCGAMMHNEWIKHDSSYGERSDSDGGNQLQKRREKF